MKNSEQLISMKAIRKLVKSQFMLYHKYKGPPISKKGLLELNQQLADLIDEAVFNWDLDSQARFRIDLGETGRDAYI